MDEHIAEQLPFYAAETISEDERVLIEKHLKICAECRAELTQWQIIRNSVRADVSNRVKNLPPLTVVPVNVQNSAKPNDVADKIYEPDIFSQGETPDMMDNQSNLTETKKPRQRTTKTKQFRWQQLSAIAAGIVLIVGLGLFALGWVNSAKTPIIGSVTNQTAIPAIQATAPKVPNPTSTPTANPIVYPGATKLSYDENLVKTVIASDSTFDPVQLNAATVGVYVTNDDPNTVIAYYKQQLTNLGYSFPPAQSADQPGATFFNAVKGNNIVSGGAISYQNLQTTSSSKLFADLDQQVKPNQTLIYFLNINGTVQQLNPPTVTPAPTQPIQTLTPYQGATKLSLDETAIKEIVLDNLSPEQRQQGEVSIYTSNDNSSIVTAYYKNQLTKLGYTFPTDAQPQFTFTLQPNDAVFYASKGNSVVVGEILSYQTVQNIPSQATGSSTPVAVISNILSQLKPNQTLILIATYNGTIYQFDNIPTPTP